ncbi:MAG: hypothetical protein ACE5R6_20330 [Candidatus Heimdallarchaeota archaeon]
MVSHKLHVAKSSLSPNYGVARNFARLILDMNHLRGRYYKIKHIGSWCCAENGQGKLAREGSTPKNLIHHFCQVNNYSQEDFETNEAEAFRIWWTRSQHEWKQNFGR